MLSTQNSIQMAEVYVNSKKIKRGIILIMLLELKIKKKNPSIDFG